LEAVLDYWKGPEGPDSAHVSHKAQAALGLYSHNPLKGPTGRTAVFVLNANGTFTVNRGYLVESGVTEADDLAEFEAELDRSFPGLPRTPKRYYLTTQPPTVEQVAGFMRWWEPFAGRLSARID